MDASGGPDITEAEAALPRRVLLVDDSRDGRNSLAELLRMMGHEVVVADDGPESLSLVDAGQTFDVALLDIGLPRMSGHALARRLRHRFGRPELRLVALTGYGLAPGGAVPSGGFDDYFVKPVDIDALLASIGKSGHAAAQRQQISAGMALARSVSANPECHPCPASLRTSGAPSQAAPSTSVDLPPIPV